MLSICTTFTSEPLGEPLGFWMDLLGLPLPVEFAPYGQVFQELIAPGSTLAGHRDGVSVLLVRLQDWCRTPGTTDGVHQAYADFRTALTEFLLQRRVAPLVFAVLPPDPALPGAVFQELQALSASCAAELALNPGLTSLQVADWEHYQISRTHDRERDELAHIPYTEEFFAALSAAIARKVHALKVPARKVLALDCDNTLWRGVVGEDGLHGIAFDPPFLALHRYASEQQKQGTLLALCSKNVEADVEEVFQVRADAGLTWSQFVLNRVNWDPKPHNLQSLAQELNLGLDSIVFLDDSMLECSSVRSALPSVVTLHVDSPQVLPRIVSNLWPLDKVHVTAEDLQRTEMYRQNAARNRAAQQTGTLGEFLAQLELKVETQPPQEEDWTRVSQLTQRTNQFNLTTLRRSEAELRALAAAGTQVRIVRVSDRFGDYGSAGVMLFRAEAGALIVDTLLLSCRVLGRGVEHAMLRELGQFALSRNLADVVLPFHPTKKNEPALKFLRSLGEARCHDVEGGQHFVLSAQVAANVTVPEAVLSGEPVGEERLPAGDVKGGGNSDDKAGNQVGVAGRPSPSEMYQRIATELCTAADIVAAVREQRSPRVRALSSSRVEAQTEPELRMLRLWEEVLGMWNLGVEDDYFDLGGTSLLAVELSVAVDREFGIRLPLTAVVEAPTVRRLLARMQHGSAQGLLPLRAGGERHFFLIHDGDGETLLYRNLAERLPRGFSVYGVQPLSSKSVPLCHTRLEEMANHYIHQIKAVAPEGPYFLGGMCAGGTLSFAVAAELEARGDHVEALVIMDAAAPLARKRRGVITRDRWRGFTASLRRSANNDVTSGTSDGTSDRRAHDAATEGVTADHRFPKTQNPASEPPPDSGPLAKGVAVLRYELSQGVKGSQARYYFRKLRAALDAAAAQPGAPADNLNGLGGKLTFRQIYDLAAESFQPRVFHGQRVLLTRATSGEGGDRPFKELFAEVDLGWQRYLRWPLTIVDVDGGHASMLQTPHVDSLAQAIRALLPDEAQQDGFATSEPDA